MSVVFAYCTACGRSGVVTTLSLLNTIRVQHNLEKMCGLILKFHSTKFYLV
jgi:hypothetical protein